MRGVRGFSDPTALRQEERNLPVFFQRCADHENGCELPFNLITAEGDNSNGVGIEGLGMGKERDYGTWNHGRMDGYCPVHKGGSDQISETLYPLGGGEFSELSHGMGYFTRTEMPFYHALANSFTSGDNYFQSTSTQTNRIAWWRSAVPTGPRRRNSRRWGYGRSPYPHRRIRLSGAIGNVRGCRLQTCAPGPWGRTTKSVRLGASDDVESVGAERLRNRLVEAGAALGTVAAAPRSHAERGTS
ncbi:alkaline phosphatase family protein [Streptomyces sp. NBC_01210]|uniref:alkaline phosphatase family protein n=1 Tax=Streptomyces sp. NBC_01210 TaxID=2903774 RepID=UPI003FA368C4